MVALKTPEIQTGEELLTAREEGDSILSLKKRRPSPKASVINLSVIKEEEDQVSNLDLAQEPERSKLRFCKVAFGECKRQGKQGMW